MKTPTLNPVRLIKNRQRAADIEFIRSRASEISRYSSAHFERLLCDVRYQLLSAKSRRRVMCEVLAIACCAIERSLGVRPHDQQIRGGMELINGRIIEMKTGEGKTLTGVFPALYFGLLGQGYHVLTANSYLSSRDFELLKPILELLHLKTGLVREEMNAEQRKLEYAADVTFLSFREVGFDFLRDRLAGARKSQRIQQRGLPHCLVDEVDSLLLDEARTPLIIAAHSTEESERVSKLAKFASNSQNRFTKDTDFIYVGEQREICITQAGRRLLRQLVASAGFGDISYAHAEQMLQHAIRAHRLLVKGKHYAVVHDEVKLIDEHTGRIADGKQMQNGLHQCIEAKEALPISPITETSASTDVRSLMRQYRSFCGMTGTACTAKKDFWLLYRKRIEAIECRLPVARKRHPTIVCPSTETKEQEILRETRDVLSRGQAVLIGTSSVADSQSLSRLFTQHGLKHHTLNAINHRQEAEIIAIAGRSQTVTIATNMAGRGTDIKISDDVRMAGGLHVILTGLHESSRIDHQLIGRCARQGDPGSYRYILSTDDEIPRKAIARSRLAKLAQLVQSNRTAKAPFLSLSRAQNRIEARNRRELHLISKTSQKREKLLEQVGIDPFCSA